LARLFPAFVVDHCEGVMSTKSGSSYSSSSIQAAGSARRGAGGAAVAEADPVRSPAVARSSQTRHLTLSYYPWITQSISGAPLHKAIVDFADLLQAELRRGMGEATHLKPLDAMEVPAQLTQMKDMPTNELTCKIGLLNPLGFALVNKQVPTIESVAVIRRKIGADPAGPTYKAQLYAHRKTFLTSQRDVKLVRGRSVGFGSRQSTSNFLVPAIMLLDAGIHPLNGLSRIEFTGGHDKSAAAVYEGRVEVGAGHDGVIFDLATKPGYADAEQVLQRIDFSKDIPSDPVAVHTSDPAVRDQVRDALLRVAKPNDRPSAGNQVVKRFWGTDEGFEPIASSKYAVLFDHMKRLNLGENDMIGKI
jgi:ABC-type phosphate/phosphonate transport system substrate-binding protein